MNFSGLRSLRRFNTNRWNALIRFNSRIFSSKQTPELEYEDTHEINPEELGDNVVSEVVPLVPISKHPIFPGLSVLCPITPNIDLERFKGYVGLFVAKNDKLISKTGQTFMQRIVEIDDPDDIYDYGAYCQVDFKEVEVTGQKYIEFKPKNKIKRVDTLHPESATIEHIIEKSLFYEDQEVEIQAKIDYLRKQCKNLLLMNERQNPNLAVVRERFAPFLESNDLNQFFNFLGIFMLSANVDLTNSQMQGLFETFDLERNIEQYTHHLLNQLKKTELMDQIQKQVDDTFDKKSRRMRLEEMYEKIKEELGLNQDERINHVNELRANLEGKKVPDDVNKLIEAEITKYLNTDRQSAESAVIRTHIEWMTQMPWGVSQEENFDITTAQNILDDSHYGMDKLKERILEFIAVGNLRKSVNGKILCFIGPPGVGKTSIGESIANALNRKFIRIALGGDSDTSILKGHRRAYVGAAPGKIASALKAVQCENPVILLDEIDKIGSRSMQGDPSSALIEILDPSQNHSFQDHFLDAPLDLSRVLFLCTANYAQNIHPILKDRMEVIWVSGYTHNEKKHILWKYLYNKAIESNGLEDYQHLIELTEEAVNKLIIDYCREAGVRSLEKCINRIMQKCALKLLKREEMITVDHFNLKDYLGNPVFSSKKRYTELPVGIIVGLVAHEGGGDIAYIEVSKVPARKDRSRGTLQVTGNIKDVMRESSMIALTYAKTFVNNHLGDLPGIYSDMHLHFPEGGTPKDGPSAGIAICSAYLSLALNKAIPRDTAMTGEITLTGKVLPIGGVREKTMSSQREGMKTLIFPQGNEADIEELPENIKEGLTFHFVENYIDVFKIVFPDVELTERED